MNLTCRPQNYSTKLFFSLEAKLRKSENPSDTNLFHILVEVTKVIVLDNKIFKLKIFFSAVCGNAWFKMYKHLAENSI